MFKRFSKTLGSTLSCFKILYNTSETSSTLLGYKQVPCQGTSYKEKALKSDIFAVLERIFTFQRPKSKPLAKQGNTEKNCKNSKHLRMLKFCPNYLRLKYDVAETLKSKKQSAL